MDLKKALTVCLISLFSATLVVLIARALDLQAAARLEPQLARIVEELEALRQQGGIAAAPSDWKGESRLIVYYFHGRTRCVTCCAVESQAHDVVHSDFARELQAGTVAWKAVNYEEPAGAGLAKQFRVPSFAVVLAKMQGSQILQWRRLDRAGVLAGDKPRFASYVRDEIDKLLRPAEAAPTSASSGDKPEARDSVSPAADPPADLPIPE
jgi:hypothetical protein